MSLTPYTLYLKNLMTTTTQQISPDPALDFAQSVLDVTNNGLELIEILRDIAEDHENANTNDRITAANSLMDRSLGKPRKQINPRSEPSANAAPETANHLPNAKREAVSSRLVTQIDDSLNQSIGPAPATPQTPGYFDHNSIHFTIQKHILDITNNGQTLRDTLLQIARACPEPVEGAEDNPRITSYHRRRAASILVDRVLGTDSTPVLRAVQDRPELSQSVPPHPDYPPGYIIDPTKSCLFCSHSLGMKEGHEGEHRRDLEGLAKARAEVQRIKDELGIKPDPNRPKIDWHISSPSREWVLENADLVRKEAAEFRAKLDLQAERRAQWPEIEERRRKKLAQIYPSHSDDDDDPPDP